MERARRRMMRWPLAIGAAVHACTAWQGSAAAQLAHMVKDINTSTRAQSSDPAGFVSLVDVAYFTAWEVDHGRELWKTDGTKKGTAMVADLVPGPDSSQAELSPGGISIAHIGRTILFAARRSETGVELWRTDGELNGTRLVRDIRPGPGGSSPHAFTVVGDVLFFLADDGAHGDELWRTDGTTDGTQRVIDLTPGIDPTTMHAVTTAGGVFVFQAQEGTQEGGLWRTAGTPGSTALLAPLSADSWYEGLARPGAFIEIVQNSDGLQRIDLWNTDGTPDGTAHVELAKFDGGGFVRGYAGHSVLVDDRLFFSFPSGECPAGYWIPWMIDGEDLSTLQEGPCLGVDSPMVALGGDVFFFGFDELARGLFKMNAKTSVVELVMGFPGVAAPSQLTIVDGSLLFALDDNQEGAWLWRSDGTLSGTARFAHTGVISMPLSIVGSSAIFAATDGIHGNELWGTDLTTGGTTMLRDIADGGFASSPVIVTVSDLWLLFHADDGVHGRTLWRTDGTAERTSIVRDARGEFDGAAVIWADAAGNATYILEQGDAASLWMFDNAGNTMMSRELGAPSAGTHAASGGTLYFFTLEGASSASQMLWRSDGTPESTTTVKEVGPDVFDIVDDGMGVAFFVHDVDMGKDTSTLWHSDGTADGTRPVRTFLGMPSYPLLLDRMVFFAMSGDEGGTWKFDPRTPELTRFTEVGFRSMGGSGGRLFALGTIDDATDSLWRTDGTPEGTQLVAQVARGFDRVVVSGQTAFFVASAPLGEVPAGLSPYRALWSSDGTASGTRMLLESFSGYLSPITSLPDLDVVFTMGTLEVGSEPWVSDGTTEGTHVFQDIAPGAHSSSPQGFVVGSDGRLYFTADDGTHGTELWTYAPAPPARPTEGGCACASAVPHESATGTAAATATLLFSMLRRCSRRRGKRSR